MRFSLLDVRNGPRHKAKDLKWLNFPWKGHILLKGLYGFDKRVVDVVAHAVSLAAVKKGIARSKTRGKALLEELKKKKGKTS